MPNDAIVDASIHLWDGGINQLSWVHAHRRLDRAFLPDDLEQDAAGATIEAVVAVEADVDAGLYLKEAAWLAQLAGNDERIRAVVAHAPLHFGPAVGSELEKLAAQPIVRGVRRLLRAGEAAAMCASADFRTAVRLLPDYRLHCEIAVPGGDLRPVLDLLAACPDVAFIIDRLTGPEGEGDPDAEWLDELAAIADHPRTDCKLAALLPAPRDEPLDDATLQRCIENVLEAFGPDRTLFSSAWPLTREAAAYPRWLAMVEATLAAVPADDRALILAGNAERAYRL